ncbi:MAG: response regulator [Rubrivivax sp.]|jgi:CheY-like chemotaxis protein|nr:response regulator [Rubrivivax sp.]
MSTPVRVLLVEDNPGDADLTRETLEAGRLHLEIDVVVDGEQALDYLLQRPPYAGKPMPDLVLLDLNLPRISGREVLEEIRRQPRLRKVPIVILTSSDAEQDIVRSYELGANCYVTKPVGFEAFQTVVRSVEGFWFTIVRLP